MIGILSLSAIHCWHEHTTESEICCECQATKVLVWQIDGVD